MEPDDPGFPGPMPFKTSPSPIHIKQEPQDDMELFPNTKQGEIINLISDDEDETSTTANVRPLGSPFRSHSKRALPNLGSSLLSKPKTVPPAQGASSDVHKLYREKLLGKAQKGAKETAQRFRNNSQQVKRTRTPSQATSNGMFVTDSRPGTPDAAEAFLALQRDVDKKRQRGALSFEEDIRYLRAKDAEMARISKLQSDMAYDEYDDSPPPPSPEDEDEDDDDLRSGPGLAELLALNDDSSDDNTESKKRGLKRKMPRSTKPPKKRGKVTKSDETEVILAKARGKAAAKTTAKGKRKAPASKATGASKGEHD
jgi:hypothetical protein